MVIWQINTKAIAIIFSHHERKYSFTVPKSNYFRNIGSPILARNSVQTIFLADLPISAPASFPLDCQELAPTLL
jgi:hypothetical protein